jgi:transposase
LRHPGSGRYPQKGCTMTTEKTDAIGPGRGGRMSRQRKRDAVLRLLRGEDLDTVSRALGVTAATLSGWREAFLEGGEASLANQPIDGEERESDRLKARLGEMLLERELLEQKIALLEGSGPLARRRSRR